MPLPIRRKNAPGVVCLRKINPKKSKNILLSMAKMSKNSENAIRVVIIENN
jgi:hypothetical protein